MDTLEYNCFHVRPDASVLRWQSVHRLRGVAALGLATLGAQAAGALGGSKTQLIVALLAYGLAVRLCGAFGIRPAKPVRPFVIATAIADLLAIFFIARLVLTPMYWPAALLACVLSLHFATYYQDRAVVWLAIVGTTAGYVALISVPAAQPIDHVQLWLLTIYAVAALVFAGVQRRINRRVTRIVELFAEARTGDLGGAYDVRADDMPDGVTRIGHAYNRLRKDLGTLVTTDALSGCLNLRGFERAAERTLWSADPVRAPLALIALDLDDFKSINDEHGHIAGDFVIRETGATLRAHVRAGDLVARLGGEEFGIILPDTPLAAAEALANRLVERVRLARFAALPQRQVTISAGVAMFEGGTSPNPLARLRSKADAALYTAKRKGRDRVCVADQTSGLWRTAPLIERQHAKPREKASVP